jgi:hypothetical protein
LRVPAFRCRFLQDLVQPLEHALHIPHDGQIGRAILADLSGIDVNVNHFGVRRESRETPRNTVVESDT